MSHAPRLSTVPSSLLTTQPLGASTPFSLLRLTKRRIGEVATNLFLEHHSQQQLPTATVQEEAGEQSSSDCFLPQAIKQDQFACSPARHFCMASVLAPDKDGFVGSPRLLNGVSRRPASTCTDSWGVPELRHMHSTW